MKELVFLWNTQCHYFIHRVDHVMTLVVIVFKNDFVITPRSGNR